METSGRLDRLRRDLHTVGDAAMAAMVDAFWRDLRATGTPLVGPGGVTVAACMGTGVTRRHLPRGDQGRFREAPA